jgi:hypothetical protein
MEGEKYEIKDITSTEYILVDRESKHSVETKNRMFDTVLSLNLLQKDKKKLEILSQMDKHKKDMDAYHEEPQKM